MQTETYKDMLLDSQAELERRLNAIKQDVRNETNPVSRDSEEQSIERENDEVVDALGNAAREELAQIKAALARIETGEYFDCVVCGEPIGEARLETIPYTDRCVKCAENE